MHKNSKLYAAISYITWVGFIISLLLRDKDDTLVRRHLNQALIINVIETIGGILIRVGGLFGVVGEIVDIACLVLFVMGIVRALKMSEEPLPLIGNFNMIT